MVRRFVRVLIALMLAWVGLGNTGAVLAAPSSATVVAYEYDGADNAQSTTYTAMPTEPPFGRASTAAAAGQRALDPSSYHPLARMETATTYGYNHLSQLVRLADIAATTREQAQRSRGASSPIAPSGVAANTGTRLAEASGSAFRAADNVGDFTVSAKHLPGAGGRWNKWAEGVDINNTIASALRSDGATFLPEAGAATDRFIVRTNMGTAIGTRGETYVKAVISNDGRIITAYPVK